MWPQSRQPLDWTCIWQRWRVILPDYQTPKAFCFYEEHPLLHQEAAHITSTRSRKHTHQKASSRRLAMVLKGLRKRSFCHLQWTLEGEVGSEDLWLSEASLLQSPWTNLHQWDRRPWRETESSRDRAVSRWSIDPQREPQPFLHVSSMFPPCLGIIADRLQPAFLNYLI